MLDMLLPCRSDHMSNFYPLTSATFHFELDPTWGGVQIALLLSAF